MWTARRITADAANKMQIDSGLLLKQFNISNPVAPADADIICETTGNFKISCKPEFEDLFDNVNNAPKNSAEGKRIVGWNCSLAVTAFSITDETIQLALGAYEAAGGGVDGTRPKNKFATADFTSLYWVGDMLDGEKVLVVVMDRTVSVNGFDFTSTNRGKGELALEFMPHVTISDPDKVPMAFYILEKVGTATPV